jgi:hypothetical protein
MSFTIAFCHDPALSSFMTYNWICKINNTTRATRRRGTGYTSGAPDFTTCFSGVRVARSLVFCVILCRSLFVLLCLFTWPLYCLFVFDLRLLITAFDVFKFFATTESSILGQVTPIFGSGFNVTGAKQCFNYTLYCAKNHRIPLYYTVFPLSWYGCQFCLITQKDNYVSTKLIKGYCEILEMAMIKVY